MSTVRIGSRSIEISSEDKLLFPAAGLTKGDVARYYRQVAELMVREIADRPAVMQRFPDGIDRKGFFHKDAPDYFPEWIERVRVHKREGGSIDHVVCNEPATLVYLANQNCVTLHHWLSRVQNLEKPDLMVFDLDPAEGRFGEAVRAAQLVRELLADLALTAFVKTTGGKGLHVVVPIAPEPFAEVRRFSEDVARVLAQREPDRLTTQFRIAERQGRLYLDNARNAFGQHVVAPYSLRPLDGAPVATPIDWDELDGKLRPGSFTPSAVVERVQAGIDPWSGMRGARQSLAGARGRLDELSTERS